MLTASYTQEAVEQVIRQRMNHKKDLFITLEEMLTETKSKLCLLCNKSKLCYIVLVLFMYRHMLKGEHIKYKIFDGYKVFAT